MPNGAVKFRTGPKGEIWLFVRNGRIPGREFIDATPEMLLKRFERAWDRFAQEGMNSASHDSFKPMGNGGKGLWCFKEHDHRLFATQVPYPPGNPTRLAILSGWVKDKSLSREEEREVHKAQQLRGECLALDWQNIKPWTPPVEEEDFTPEGETPPPAPEKEPEQSKPGEYVKIAALASLVGVHRTTIDSWIKNGTFPAPTIDLGGGPNGGKAWPWSKLDELAEIAEKLMPKKPAKPAAAEVPAADERVESPPPADVLPPAPVCEEEDLPIPTRPQLLEAFARWVDSGETPDLQALCSGVARYRDRLNTLLAAQDELRRLTGG